MIILTGASGGIGKRIIEHLLKIDRVIGIYYNSPMILSNEGLICEQMDLREPEDIKSFVEKYKYKEELTKITLVHLAAIKIDSLAINYKEPDWDNMMNVNLRGNFLLTKALLPFMVHQRWGRIIHISSTGGMQGAVGTIAYSMTKAGLLGMSRVLAKEYARKNITSNVLSLGYFNVGMLENMKPELKQELLAQIPLKTFGIISNIANAIDFLIKSEYVTGAVINIDGGL